MAQQKQASAKKSSPKKDSSPSTNSPAELIDVLNQDVQHLQKVISDQNTQIAKLQRQFYNQDEEAPQETTSEQLDRNAVALEKFIEATSNRKEPDVFLTLRREKESRSRRNLLKYKGYGSYKQKKTPVCPCGEHQGIEFLKDGERIDHLCPRHWWVLQTWVAMDEKKIRVFVDSTPLGWYLDKYKLEAK